MSGERRVEGIQLGVFRYFQLLIWYLSARSPRGRVTGAPGPRGPPLLPLWEKLAWLWSPGRSGLSPPRHPTPPGFAPAASTSLPAALCPPRRVLLLRPRTHSGHLTLRTSCPEGAACPGLCPAPLLPASWLPLPRTPRPGRTTVSPEPLPATETPQGLQGAGVPDLPSVPLSGFRAQGRPSPTAPQPSPPPVSSPPPRPAHTAPNTDRPSLPRAGRSPGPPGGTPRAPSATLHLVHLSSFTPLSTPAA